MTLHGENNRFQLRLLWRSFQGLRRLMSIRRTTVVATLVNIFRLTSPLRYSRLLSRWRPLLFPMHYISSLDNGSFFVPTSNTVQKLYTGLSSKYLTTLFDPVLSWMIYLIYLHPTTTDVRRLLDYTCSTKEYTCNRGSFRRKRYS
jgi:hypothetical protein